MHSAPPGPRGERPQSRVPEMFVNTTALPLIRELYSRMPEHRVPEAWELWHVLWSPGHTAEPEDEGEIRAAIGVAAKDWPDRRAA